VTASKLEALFEAQIDAAGLVYVSEFTFAESLGRRWRADFRVWKAPFAGRERSVLVEIQGIGPQGRHGSWGHIESDAEKFSTAAALGWRVLIFTGKMVKDGRALALTEAALGLKPIPSKPPKKRARVKRTPKGAALPLRVRKAAGL